MWRELWGVTVSGAAWGAAWRAAWAAVWGAFTPVTRWLRHTHTLPPVLPAQGGFPTNPLMNSPPSSSCTAVPTHSSSQVVHCRVCPPHPLHAPVLVLHLAVYPASPTQGRVGSLTGCHTVHRHGATRPDEMVYIEYIVRQSSEVCFNEGFCYGNQFNPSCIIMLVGALILQLYI